MTGLVVSIEALRLESHEKGAIAAAGIFEHQAAILEHTIIARMAPVVALVHMDVMHAVPREELEILILCLWLRAEARPEGIDDGTFLTDAAYDGIFHRVFEIVVDTGNVSRHHLKLVDLHDSTSDE